MTYIYYLSKYLQSPYQSSQNRLSFRKAPTFKMLIISVLTKSSVWSEIGVLSGNITHVKFHSTALSLWFPNRYKSHLSNEVLCILVEQDAAKSPEGKVESWKNLTRLDTDLPEVGRKGKFLINLQIWLLPFLLPHDHQGCTAPHLKYLIYISLGARSLRLWYDS